jgi:hypothetical protein
VTAEMVLRLLLLKHVRNWSFDTLEREVKLNLAYRDFTRIGRPRPGFGDSRKLKFIPGRSTAS